MDRTASEHRAAGRRWRIVPVGVVLALAAWAVWAGAVRDNVRPRKFGVIEESVAYRSAALTPAALARVHEQYKIRTIVDLGGFDTDPVKEEVEAHAAAAMGIERYVFPLGGDGTGNPNAYVRALHIMADPTKQPVLVHCATGAQRTGACAKLYGLIVQGKAGSDLDADLRRYGHNANRNRALAPFLNEWTEKIRDSFRSGVPIAGYPSLDPPGASEDKTVVIPVIPARRLPPPTPAKGAAPRP